MEYSKNIQVVLDILKNEIDGDVESALSRLTDDYSMTWMYRKESGELFPTTTNDMKTELEDVYHIEKRQYDIKNIAENENLVMLELIESYPDPKTEKMHHTPMVLVLEMKNGKIKKGRHYCDPRISFEELPKEVIEEGLKNTASEILID